MGLEWESIIEGTTKWLIFPEYPIPEGYNHRMVKADSRNSFGISRCTN